MSLRSFTPSTVFLLFAVLVFTGCETEPEIFYDDHKLDTHLTGTWKDNTAGDSYTIKLSKGDYHLTYDDGYGGGYAGPIRYVSNFSDNAGVIIIEYDAGHEASYWEYDEDWNPVAPLPLKGNFLGIYYQDLQPGTAVKMAQSYSSGGAEKESIYKAILAFTMGNEGEYISYGYGTYAK